MKTNVGGIDRGIRLVAGLIAIGVGIYLKTWWGLIGVLLVGTALLRWCPAYLPFGISTKKP